MISYEQAIATITQNAHLAENIVLPLGAALGKITAEPQYTSFAIPSFNNSAMDGFAVRYEDCQSATQILPIQLPVHQVTIAGAAQEQLCAGTAIQIMTGAIVPNGADVVIPIEDVTVERHDSGAVHTISITQPPAYHQHIRMLGEDFAEATLLADAGIRLTPNHIMALAAAGISTLTVRRPPEIIVVATGNELTEGTAKHVCPSAIYNSNSPYLMAMCQAAGLNTHYLGIVPDTMTDFIATLNRIISQPTQAPRIILSTGAVSKGDYDFVPAALDSVGATIFFHRVAIKPGKPILFARLPNGDYFFGLPGNPISAAIGFRFFVTPLLRSILGLPQETPIMACLMTAQTGKSGMRRFLKARLTFAHNGQLQVSSLLGQESFKIKPLLQTNGWIMLDETIINQPVNSLVPCFLADPFSSLESTP